MFVSRIPTFLGQCLGNQTSITACPLLVTQTTLIADKPALCSKLPCAMAQSQQLTASCCIVLQGCWWDQLADVQYGEWGPWGFKSSLHMHNPALDPRSYHEGCPNSLHDSLLS